MEGTTGLGDVRGTGGRGRGADGVGDGVLEVERDASEAVVKEAKVFSAQKMLFQPFQLTFPLLNRLYFPVFL